MNYCHCKVHSDLHTMTIGKTQTENPQSPYHLVHRLSSHRPVVFDVTRRLDWHCGRLIFRAMFSTDRLQSKESQNGSDSWYTSRLRLFCWYCVRWGIPKRRSALSKPWPLGLEQVLHSSPYHTSMGHANREEENIFTQLGIVLRISQPHDVDCAVS